MRLLISVRMRRAMSASCGSSCRLSERVWKAALPVLLLCVLLLSTAYLVDATYNPFLYFRF